MPERTQYRCSAIPYWSARAAAFPERLIHAFCHAVYIIQSQAKRWHHAQARLKWAGFRKDDTLIPAGFEHLGSDFLVGRFCVTVADHFDGQHQPRAAHISDGSMPVLQVIQPLQQGCTDNARVFLQALVAYYRQHRAGPLRQR